MRFFIVALLVLPLQGCLFFYIPGSVLSQLSGWNACATEGAYVGQTLKHYDGRIGKIDGVSGRSERCQDGKLPIMVSVTYEEKK